MSMCKSTDQPPAAIDTAQHLERVAHQQVAVGVVVESQRAPRTDVRQRLGVELVRLAVGVVPTPFPIVVLLPPPPRPDIAPLV